MQHSIIPIHRKSTLNHTVKNLSVYTETGEANLNLLDYGKFVLPQCQDMSEFSKKIIFVSVECQLRLNALTLRSTIKEKNDDQARFH